MISVCIVIFFFKQKTAYEMRISDWSSDVCSSDLIGGRLDDSQAAGDVEVDVAAGVTQAAARVQYGQHHGEPSGVPADHGATRCRKRRGGDQRLDLDQQGPGALHTRENGRTGHRLALAGFRAAEGQENGRANG